MQVAKVLAKGQFPVRKNSAKFFSRNFSAKSLFEISLRNLSSKYLRKIIDLPRELIVQGDYDLARFASTLKTEKQTKALGSQSIFKKERRAL